MQSVFDIPLAFVMVCVLIELTPGPNMTYLAIVSAIHGKRAGFAMVAGIALGLAIIGIAAALGVGEILERFPRIYDTLRWLGVLYLLWLAWEGWRQEDTIAPTVVRSLSAYFRNGLVTNLLNPKALMFYVGTLPLFVGITPHPITQSLLLTATYVAIATLMHCAINLLSARASILLRDPQKKMRTRRILSGLLAVVALGFAFAG